jgi:hypothetical protein
MSVQVTLADTNISIFHDCPVSAAAAAAAEDR